MSLSSRVTSLLSDIQRAMDCENPFENLKPPDPSAPLPETRDGLGVQFELTVGLTPANPLDVEGDEDDENDYVFDESYEFAEGVTYGSLMYEIPEDLEVLHYDEANNMLVTLLDGIPTAFAAMNENPKPHEFWWATPAQLHYLTESQVLILEERGHVALVKKLRRYKRVICD